MILKRKEPFLVQSGLVLGLLAMGNLIGRFSQMLRYLLAGLALFFLIHLVIGIVTNFKQAQKQLKDPLIASVFPTFFMQGMVASTYIATWSFLGEDALFIAQGLWWLSFIGLIVLMAYYLFSFGFPFKWDNVYPAWTVLFVGIGVAPLTIAVSQQFVLGQVIFWYGLVATIFVLPLVFYKTYKIGLEDRVRPNTTTICAPISLMTAAYTTTFSHPNSLILLLLLISGQILYLFILCQIFQLFKRPFSAGFSAFTFPLVISATALGSSLTVFQLGLFGHIWFLCEVVIALITTLLVTGLYLKDIFEK